MSLFDSIVAILTITLLLTVEKWSNGQNENEFPFHYNLFNNSLSKLLTTLMNGSHSISDSKCIETVSRNVPQYIPYTETFRTSGLGFYRSAMRTNYKIEYHVLWSVEPKCCEGYVQIGKMCMPHCSPSCERGICIKPNICRCNSGYRMSLTNGRQLCIPECTNGCINGTCIDVEVCSCNDGYWMDADGFTCRPVCDIECERNHGYCAEPNVCSCRPGYTITEKDEFATLHGRCEPICDRTCTNARCTAPNICSCADGYEADESDPRFTCSPKCDEGCAFGKCTAPGICTCDDGYRMVNTSVCEPICNMPCIMGTCVAPETCSCKDGYRLFGASRYTCEPICKTGCSNGICVAPEVCSCNDGYSAANTTTCEPICSEVCVMGTCVAPETCSCKVGYVPLGDSNYTCVPSCKTGCDNGRCTAPEVCICDDGYVLDVAGHCTPVCADECMNGICTAPNHCTCDDGFASRNTNFCEPVCKGNCQNGDCVGPNQCVCHDNFVTNIRHNFSECVPACSRNCSGHGVCIVDDENDDCQCYFGWTGRDCDQPTMCLVMVDFTRSNIGKLTIYNETNSTMMRVHENAPYCHQCDDNFLDTGPFCYVIQSDETNTTIGCIVSTDFPCYMAPYNSSPNIVKIIWPLVTIIILILTSLIMAAYLLYRRHQRKKLITANTSSTLFAQEAFATESLLSENVIYL